MAKRGQNEGSIYKRKDGRWVAVASVGHKDGKRWRKSFYGATRRQVQEKLTVALRAHQQGLPPAPETQTVAAYLDNWLENSVKPRVRPRTYEGYADHVRIHIGPQLGRIRLAKLSPEHVESFLNRKLAEGLAPRTVRYMHAVLRIALGQAVKRELLPRNVSALVDPPREERKEVQPLTPDQARSLLSAVEGERLEALYSVALAVGLRKGEALGLRWKDVDLDKGTIRVQGALQRINGKLQRVEPKTNSSRRTIALPEYVVGSMRKHRARQLQDRLLAGSKWHERGLVFTTTVGTPLDGRNITRHFQRILADAGLPRKRFHDLRHTCASLLLVQGVHPRVVMDTLGHSQMSTTMDIYSHVMPALQRDAAAQMHRLLTNK